MAYDAKIILDSISPAGKRLTTFELTYPRFIHSEFLTHRVMSRNSASSRAIPTDKVLKVVEEDLVTPVWWGKNQSGMQAREELTDGLRDGAVTAWENARDDAMYWAHSLKKVGAHKQIVNRVVEPYAWITTVVTSCHWKGFFAQRCHPDAQPEFRVLAEMIRDLYEENGRLNYILVDTIDPIEIPRTVCGLEHLPEGYWHLPYVTDYDAGTLQYYGYSSQDLCMISAGRCAAVSYLNHEKHDAPKDLERAKKMIAAGHWSPFEHQAQAQTREEMKTDLRHRMDAWMEKDIPPGNLIGWTQFRKTWNGEAFT